MGQRIMVQEPIMLGDTAIFVTDRTLSGMTGASFESPADAVSRDDVPARLAAHIYEREGGVRHLYVAGNSVIAGRVLAWSDTHLAAVRRAIEDFFLHYPAS